MIKKVENVEKTECCSCNNCKCGCCWKILIAVLALIWAVAAIVAGIYACKASQAAQKLYDFNVLSAGGEENFNRMAKVYGSQGYVDYMSQYTQQGEAQFGLSEWENTDNSDNIDNTNIENNSYLDSLKNIAVELGTDEAALQTCIDESRYTDAVNDMMNLGNQLFGVNGTPWNVIVDRENWNYITIAWAYPAEDFVNAINEYKNGAENYVAWGDEVKNVVEDMLANAPVRGNKDARFTIVEYTELLCPFCQRHSQAGTINSVLEQFPEEVNSVSRHFIIHGDEALQLASAMECVAELNPSVYYDTFEKAFEGL